MWIQSPEDGKGHSECHQVAEEDTQDQVSRDSRSAEQDHQNDKYAAQYQDIDACLILIGYGFEVADAGGSADVIEFRVGTQICRQ